MSQGEQIRGKKMDKTNKALQLLNKDIVKYRTQKIKQKDTQKHKMQNMTTKQLHNYTTTSTTQKQTAQYQHSQFPASSSFPSARSHKNMFSSAPSHSQPSNITQSFARNTSSTFESRQHEQTLHSLSPVTKSFTQNIYPLSKSLSHNNYKPSQVSQSAQYNRSSSARRVDEKDEEKKEISRNIVQSLNMIIAQLRRMEERQILIEKKTDENMKAISKLTRESAVRRSIKPQTISFRTIDDFLNFEEVDEEIYNDLVGYFIYLGRTNPIDCAAEYFRNIFPKDEEISAHLTLNGKNGPGGCKLRGSRFAQACQDAMNANKYFPNPNNMQFYDALEKALKSLKTRKWRSNRKRQAPHDENEDVPPNRRRQMGNPEEEIANDIQEQTEDVNEPEDIPMEEAENAEMKTMEDTDAIEDSDVEDVEGMQNEEWYETDETDENSIDETKQKMTQDNKDQQEEQEILMDDLSDRILLFSSPPY